MPDLLSLVEFVLDIACMMVSPDEVESFGITRDRSILVSLGAVGLLVFSITVSASKEMFPNNAGAAVIVAACVVGLGFLGLGREVVTGIFIACYPPMVIALRLAEGAILGENISRHIRWWHPLLVGVAIVTSFYLLKSLPHNTLAMATAAWALIGAGIAAVAWTRVIADFPMFRSPLILLSAVAVFGATLFYVSASPLELALYQWSLPFGLIVGIVGGRVSRRRSDSEDEAELGRGGTQERRSAADDAVRRP